MTKDWETDSSRELLDAIMKLESREDAKRFLRDLLTEAEIREFSLRWRVAVLLDEEVPYTEIERRTGMSSATIARISHWLKHGTGGYRLALDRRGKAKSPAPKKRASS